MRAIRQYRYRVGVAVGAAVCLVTAAAPAGVAGAHSGSGAKAPVDVGYIMPLTGSNASNGNTEEQGFKLGLAQFGQRVDGHRIDVTYVDSHSTPTAGLSEAKALIHSDHVKVLEGPLVSSLIVEVSPYALSQGVPITDLDLVSPAQVAAYKANGMGMASGWSTYEPATEGAAYAYKTLGWRHITTVAYDFGYGWESVGGFADEFGNLGGTVDKQIWVPANATDLSSYVSQIPATTQGVFVVLAAALAANFVTEYASFGLKTKIPLMGITTLTDQSALPGEKRQSAIGTLTTAQYCDGITTNANQRFANAFHAAYGHWPGYYSESSYVRAEILVTALKKLHGVVKSEKALGQAMREVQISAPRGPVTINKQYFTATQNSYLCKVATVHGSLRNVPFKTFKDVAPWGLLSQSQFATSFAKQSAGRP